MDQPTLTGPSIISPTLIGVDLGTSVIKATLFDVQGNAIAHAARPAVLHQPAPGIAEQDPDEFVAKTESVLAEVIEKTGVSPSSVAAIGFDGQMGGLLGIDSDWNAVTPWYPSTLDSRYQPYNERIEAEHGNRVFEVAGAAVLGAPRMAWWQDQQPEVYREIAKVQILANFVAGRLAGLKADDAFIDPSYLTWIGTADTQQRAWSDELLDIWGLCEGRMPGIVPSATVVGSLSAESASRCGLVEGVPLVAGAGDQVAGFVGAGLVDANHSVDVAGTFPVFATYQDRFIVDSEHCMLQALAGPLGEDNWYWMMYIGGGGLTHRWFVEQFGCSPMAKEQFGCSPMAKEHFGGSPMAKGESIYAGLDTEAETLSPGSDGLLFIPHLAGRICPMDADVRGAWLGFTWTHTRAHLYRAMLESIAYDYAQALRVLSGYNPESALVGVNVIGGGANSTVWNQIKADVLDLPYHTLAHADRAALGGALIAGHAVGLYPDLAQIARECAQSTAQFTPQPDVHAAYLPYIDAYINAFDQLRPTYHALASLR